MKRWMLLFVITVLMLTGCALEDSVSDIQKVIDSALSFANMGASVQETARAEWPGETAHVSVEVTAAPAEPTIPYTEEKVREETEPEELPAIVVPATSPAPNTLCKVCGQDYSEIFDSYDGFCGPCYIDQLPPQVCERCHKSFKVVYIPTNGICPECERTPFAFECLECGTPCISFNEKHICDDCEARFCYVCWEVTEEGHVCEE